MIAVVVLPLLANSLPEANVTAWYLVAWVAVAFIGGTPGVVAAVLSSRNRRETRHEIQAVKHEVMPNGGSSSFDLLHRLVWETHERTGPIPELVRRVDELEAAPRCPYSSKEEP